MKKLVYAVLSCLLLSGVAFADGPEPAVGKATGGGPGVSARLAVGVGMPFGGGVGGNLEAGFGRHFAATAGLGSVEGYLGWAAGARVYPLGRDERVNPRLSAYYGTVAVLDRGYGNIETDTGAALWRRL